MARFSEQYLRTLKPGERAYKISEDGVKGEGRLMVKVLTNGRREFYYRYRQGTSDKLLLIGRHQQLPKDGGITLAEARTQLAELIQQHRNHGDVKAHRMAEAAAARDAALKESRKGTFGQLLTGYVNALREAEKSSAADVENMFKNHAFNAFPELIEQKAKDIQPDDITDVLARMVNKGITRRVNMMRSYLSAAFTWGAQADNHPVRTSKKETLFGITTTPVKLVPVVTEFEKAGERCLSEEELKKLWAELDKLNTIPAKTIQVTLLLGGQRLVQLMRTKWSDIDESMGVLTLRDPKGRGDARDHLVPLTEWVNQVLEPFELLNSGGEFIFSTTRGKKPICVTTLSHLIEDLSDKLEADHQIKEFRLGDLRRTTETLLAKCKIDLQTRAWLLSHGRAGSVQKKHYDKYAYLPQKTEALATWEKFLANLLAEPSQQAPSTPE